MAIEYGEVVLTVEDRVAFIELNAPGRLNALHQTTLEADLAACLMDLRVDDSVRVAVLTGRGRAFSAGAYLGDPPPPRDPRDANVSGARRLAYGYSYGQDFWLIFHDFPKPIIAAVNGYAIGGGWKLAWLCDLIVAGESAIFQHGELDLAETPTPMTASYLPRMVGKHRAAEMYYFSRRLTAQECLELGLVNRVVPDERCVETAMSMAKELADKSPIAVAFAKRLMNRAIALDADYKLDRTLALFNRASEETIAGWRAGAEKLRAAREDRRHRRTTDDVPIPE